MGKRRRRSSRDSFWTQQYGGMPVWGLTAAGAVVVGLAVLAASNIPDAPVTETQPRPVVEQTGRAASEQPSFEVTDLDFTATTEADGDIQGTLNGNRVRLIWDPSIEPVGTAVYSHGQAGDVNDRVGTPWFTELASQGWVIATGDLGLRNWGNAKSVQQLAELTVWAEQQIPTDHTMLLAGSMGGLSTLNAMRLGAVSAECWYGTMPVVDVNTVLRSVPGARAEVSAAQPNGVTPDYLRVVSNDPPLPDALYRVRSSPDDTWVPAAGNAEVLKEMLGAKITSSEATGEHGDPSHFDVADVLAFAETCAS